jgi:hypothetical protein
MERTPPIARRVAITLVTLFVLSVAVIGGAESGSEGELRPQIVVADTASGCPSVAGAFVALLDPARGMLLLSAAPFPGGHVVGDARSAEMTVSIPGAAGWTLDRVGSGQGQVPLWGARYPFLAASGRGCVGFDKQRWSSEGDLVTYLRWLVEEIYLQLPIEERQRRPDFRLSERQISIHVERPGYGPFHLTGKEGATLACRYSDAARIYLFMPFVLDEATGRVAVRISYTDGEYFDTSTKSLLGWVVASPDEPGSLSEPPLTVTVAGVFPSEK